MPLEPQVLVTSIYLQMTEVTIHFTPSVGSPIPTPQIIFLEQEVWILNIKKKSYSVIVLENMVASLDAGLFQGMHFIQRMI